MARPLDTGRLNLQLSEHRETAVTHAAELVALVAVTKGKPLTPLEHTKAVAMHVGPQIGQAFSHRGYPPGQTVALARELRLLTETHVKPYHLGSTTIIPKVRTARIDDAYARARAAGMEPKKARRAAFYEILRDVGKTLGGERYGARLARRFEVLQERSSNAMDFFEAHDPTFEAEHVERREALQATSEALDEKFNTAIRLYGRELLKPHRNDVNAAAKTFRAIQSIRDRLKTHTT